MGARFWSHVVPYQEDILATLEALREQEFRAGRFWQPSEIQPGFFGRLLGRAPFKPRPPRNIQEACDIADVSGIGTRSVLDMEQISSTQATSAAWLIPPDELRKLFSTDQPTRKMVEDSEELIEMIDRGQGVCIVTYQQGKPEGIYFAGYSYD